MGPLVEALSIDEAKAFVKGLLQDAERQRLQAIFNAKMNIGVDEALTAKMLKLTNDLSSGIQRIKSDPELQPYLP